MNSIDTRVMTTYWLFKSEPETWSWQDQCEKKITPWDGVRNYQARNFMKQMQKGDLGLFYQSVKNPQIKGIVRVIKPYYPDPQDPRFGMVDVEFVDSFKESLLAKPLRQDPKLASLLLWKQSRLSVMPVSKPAWDHLIKLGGLDVRDY